MGPGAFLSLRECVHDSGADACLLLPKLPAYSIDRVAYLGYGLGKFFLADAERLRPIPHFVFLAHADARSVSGTTLLQVVRHGEGHAQIPAPNAGTTTRHDALTRCEAVRPQPPLLPPKGFPSQAKSKYEGSV
jgi:hypothetical protein